ncbi:hypothetical protein JAF83_003979 [Citrobacter werkmanii]|nr:hypothetical protein [Citrobacter werkmanii]
MVKMPLSLRLMVWLQLSRHLFQRQAAPGQPLPVFVADNPGAQLSFQAVKYAHQRRREHHASAILAALLL